MHTPVNCLLLAMSQYLIGSHLFLWTQPNGGSPVNVRIVVSTLLPANLVAGRHIVVSAILQANLVAGCQTIKDMFGAKRESLN